jgi:hypothetical protein
MSRNQAPGEASHYYDPDGRLRFSFWWTTSPVGARLETRVYLAANGRLVQRISDQDGAPELHAQLPSVLPDPERFLRSCGVAHP